MHTIRKTNSRIKTISSGEKKAAISLLPEFGSLLKGVLKISLMKENHQTIRKIYNTTSAPLRMAAIILLNINA